MILNDEQLDASNFHLKDLNSWIAELESKEKHSSNQLRKMQLNGFYGFAMEIKEEIEEYESLCNGKLELPQIIDLSNLPTLLIQTRIARGWSQKS